MKTEEICDKIIVLGSKGLKPSADFIELCNLCDQLVIQKTEMYSTLEKMAEDYYDMAKNIIDLEDMEIEYRTYLDKRDAVLNCLKVLKNS